MNERVRSILVFLCLVLAGSVAALAQWSTDPTVNTAIGLGENDQVQPKVMTLADGSAYISWFDNSTGGYDVRLQKLDATGAPLFTSAGLLVADRGLSWTTDYGLDIDTAGNAYLAFNDDRSGTEQITATKVSPAGEQLWGATGVQLTSDATGKYAPEIVATTDGNAVVAWTGENRKGLSSVLIAKIDSSGAIMWDALVGPAHGYTSLMFSHIVASDEGSVIVSWVRTDRSRYRNLVAQKFNDKGRPKWGKGVAVLDGLSTLQGGEFPSHVSDGAGGAVFAWYNTGPLEALVQHVDASGAQMFPSNGLPVSTNPAYVRVNPSLAYDAATGDAYVVYYQYDPYSYIGGIYAQRISKDGVREWTDDGKQLMPDSDASYAWPTAVFTPTGLLGAWIQSPLYAVDQSIYGAKIDSGGSVVCPIFPISVAPGSKNRIDAEATAAGGAILAWEDGRVDFDDLYAQRIGSNCNLGLVP